MDLGQSTVYYYEYSSTAALASTQP